MTLRTGAAFTAALFFTPALGAATVAAATAAGTSPIVVDGCSAALVEKAPSATPTVSIAFHDARPVATADVAFRVAWRSGTTDTLTASGPFGSGAQVRRAVRAGHRPAAYGDTSVTCTPIAAHFTDGTAWTEDTP
jgi:hypothetical protein